MAERFAILTKYIPRLIDDKYGEWVIDKENDGTKEHPIQIPFVRHSDVVRAFIQDIYKCMDANEDMGLNHCRKILEKNGIEWSRDSMKDADIASLDAQCIMALIIGAHRADRFCEGALYDFFKSGCIEKWLNRLKAIDEE